MRKSIKKLSFAIFAVAVLCAGMVSARQLSLTVQGTTCRGFCSKKVPCPNVLGCACVFNSALAGTCQLIADKPAQ
ncbi:MAG TPA: hypothetical protein VHA33_23225 [Candidatus Angelobacter sp.]|jgi:hypothetical protein|nr:hypothetical protein [Candidatus Angelobacter sp.]